MIPLGLAETREVFVIDTIRGTKTYLTTRDLAAAVVDGEGFVVVTQTFEATARILTDGITAAVELTEVLGDAHLDHTRERQSTRGLAARKKVRDRHIDHLVERIAERRAHARIAKAMGLR